jgi:hypothetical protein
MNQKAIGSRKSFSFEKVLQTRAELKGSTSTEVHPEPTAGPAHPICGYDADNFVDSNFRERLAAP